MTDEPYTNERIIGHGVKAEYEEYETPAWLTEATEKLGVETRDRPDYVRITEGDVDHDTREVRVTVEELREMALHHTDLEEP